MGLRVLIATRPAVDTPDGGGGDHETPHDVLYMLGYVQGAYDYCDSHEAPSRQEVVKAAEAAFAHDFPITASTPPPTPDAVASGQGVGEDDAWCAPAIEAAMRDAERYRAMRDEFSWTLSGFDRARLTMHLPGITLEAIGPDSNDFDTAIDAAIAARGGVGGSDGA